MKKLFLPIFASFFLIISCDDYIDQPIEIEEIEIINLFGEPIFISGIYEIGLSNLIDPSPIINLDESNSLIKLEPNESKGFSTEEIIDYYPGADFRIFIYGFGVMEAEDPTKLVQMISIFTVENKELVRNNYRIPVSR